MAPEQSRGDGQYNFKVDIYSLGTVFFDMWWNPREKSVQLRNKIIGLLSQTNPEESKEFEDKKNLNNSKKQSVFEEFKIH